MVWVPNVPKGSCVPRLVLRAAVFQGSALESEQAMRALASLGG